MKKGRRDFLKASALGSAVIAGGTLPASTGAAQCEAAERPLEILVLGGTGFIGPHMVREALRRGHSVTLFNRGRTNTSLFKDLESIRGDRGGDLSVLEGRQWDAVIDNSGYIPRHVENSAATLSPGISHYLYISSVSVYASWAQANDENSPLATIDDESIEQVTGETYGPLKALCEKRAAAEIGDERLTILRPTYICGPGDHTDRFSYWPVRTSRGGEMIWPGSPSNRLQIIDVRDLAHFTIDCLDRSIKGIYNTVTPVDSYKMGNLLEDSEAITAAEVQAAWVDEPFAAQAVANNPTSNWGLFPAWHGESSDESYITAVSGTKARAAGLCNRPVKETIRDLMAWWQTLPEERTATPRAGMTPELEAQLIEQWKERST